jgi:hypothetical protein
MSSTSTTSYRQATLSSVSHCILNTLLLHHQFFSYFYWVKKLVRLSGKVQETQSPSHCLLSANEK